MFKTIISPVQAWLLSQNRCVGCGTNLSEGISITKDMEVNEVTCKKCGRFFIYNKTTKKYKRAPLPQKKE